MEQTDSNDNRIIFHIDVNSAFLSWTALDLLKKGELTDIRTVPSIIGNSIGNRPGVVLAKSIPAKKYQIQTGEPITAALRKCPNLVVAAPNHHSYEEYSQKFMAFLEDLCPDIEVVSIDECFLDFTSVLFRYSSFLEAANQIRSSILQKFGFTVNIGISDKKILAKMASDFKKPNLVHTLFTHEIQEKMWILPISSLYLCGRSSQQILHKLEIITIGDLAQADPVILSSHLKSQGRTLWEYANGIDPSHINSQPTKSKGIGNSTTLGQDAKTREDALVVLLSLCESVSKRLRNSRHKAGVINVEIRYSTFHTVSHQTTLKEAANSTNILYQASVRLFDELWDLSPVRLLGVRTSKLTDITEPRQMTLFDTFADDNTLTSPNLSKLQKLDTALDSIRKKYGDNAIIRGGLLHKEK